MERKHALLSASSANRWLMCPPSAQINEDFEDGVVSVYALEGTLAHDIGELKLRLELGEITKRKFNAELKKIKNHELFYEGMVEDVQVYVDLVMELYKEYQEEDPHAEIFIEQRLDYSKYAPEGFGTGDAVILSKETVHVIDLKFGKGVVVDANDNPQLKLYALGAYEELGFLHDLKTAKATIAQVRLGSTPTFETSVEDLITWAEDVVAPVAELAFKGSGEFKAGDWCRWCKFGPTCRARADHFINLYDEKKDRELTPEEVGLLLALLDEMSAWIKDVQDGATKELTEGGTIPGWKLVEGRSNRRISDPDGLAEILLEEHREEDIFKPKELITLGGLEKLVGKKKFLEISSSFITKPPGKPALAPESDKRPAIYDVADELEFED